jgi:hypothetical protein
MNPFEYISTHVYTKIKPSKFNGVGVFAIKDIPNNTNPFELWEGKTGYYPIKESELKTLPKEVYSHIKDVFLYSPNFPQNTDTYIKLVNGCHWIHQNPYYFVNSGFEKSNIDKDTFLTTRIIKSSEEILSNYKRYERYNKNYFI